MTLHGMAHEGPVQIESAFACETCGGRGFVTEASCEHSGRCPCASVECPDCYAGAIPCERCFDRPASVLHAFEYAEPDKVCQRCVDRYEGGPSDGECHSLGMSASDMWESQAAARALK